MRDIIFNFFIWSDYIMVACEKLHIIKFKKMLFNDDIELGNFEYFYVNIYFINTL